MGSNRGGGRAFCGAGLRGLRRASSSFNEQQVEAMLAVLARLDVHRSNGELIPPGCKAAVAQVRGKFINMRGSITAAKAAESARLHNERSE